MIEFPFEQRQSRRFGEILKPIIPSGFLGRHVLSTSLCFWTLEPTFLYCPTR